MVRIGIIGYGYMGKVHTQAYLNLPFHYDFKKIKLVGVSDTNAVNLEQARNEAEFDFGTMDYRELIERDDIDVIDCCVPTFLHKDIFMRCIDARKHIYMEKPMAISLEEGNEMLEAIKGTGLLCQLAFQNRFSPAIIRTKEIIDEGTIGEIINFRISYYGSEYIGGDRKLGWQIMKDEAGGGALVSLGSHCIDLARYFTNDEFGRVFATTQNRIGQSGSGKEIVPEVETSGQMIVEMRGGAIGTIEVSQVAAGSNIDIRYEIFGTKGTIRFNHAYPDFLDLFRQGDVCEPLGGVRGFTQIQTLQKYETQKYPPWRVGVNWLRYAVESQYSFLKCLVGGTSPRPSVEDGLKVQEILEACYCSARVGQWMTLKGH